MSTTPWVARVTSSEIAEASSASVTASSSAALAPTLSIAARPLSPEAKSYKISRALIAVSAETFADFAAVSAAAIASAAEKANTLVVSLPPVMETADENDVSALLERKTTNSSALPADATTSWLPSPSRAALIAVMVADWRAAASIPLATVTATSIDVWPLLRVVVITSPVSRVPVIESTSTPTVASSRADEMSYALAEIKAAPRLVWASAACATAISFCTLMSASADAASSSEPSRLATAVTTFMELSPPPAVVPEDLNPVPAEAAVRTIAPLPLPTAAVATELSAASAFISATRASRISPSVSPEATVCVIVTLSIVSAKASPALGLPSKVTLSTCAT